MNKPEKKEVAVAQVKGVEGFIYLTPGQADFLIKANNSPDSKAKTMLFRVGKYVFKPTDVLFMEFKRKEWYDLPSYCLKAFKNASKRLK